MTKNNKGMILYPLSFEMYVRDKSYEDSLGWVAQDMMIMSKG
jgi:hypothetical protein